MELGLVEIYTGNGKGKTTAAVGLSVRAAGWGLKVALVHFMKVGGYGESRILKRHSNITERFYGMNYFITTDKNITGPSVVMYRGLIGEKEVLKLLKERPRGVELVITGRYATQAMIDAADLVTEMREIKHPYMAGLAARKGIEF